MPLATAREISGVRAVFGETYPDPVRVVSVGVEVEEILKDVKDPRWNDISIEFCGGTHVSKSGEIRELVILEESGIAKGIRRIIAVTGDEALQAQLTAVEFEKRLEKLRTMEHGTAKETEMKQVQLELNQLSISAVQKAKFRDLFARINKQVLDDQKAQQKVELKKAQDLIKAYFDAEENKGRSTFVAKLPATSNAKVVSESINFIKSL